MKNLPMDLLRTFVTIKDLGGFTPAGTVLGRSQPAISLQLKRLEEQLGVQLFNRNGQLELTEEGQMLYNHARKILEINDNVVSHLTTTVVSGTVRLGIPNDFEVSYLPVMLSKFARAHPNVTLDVSSDLSVHLRQGFKERVYDLVMTMDNHPSEEFADGDFIIEPLSWVMSPTFGFNTKQPIPLVVYPKGCIYREHIIQTLNNANIPWRVLYCSSSLLGIQSAIEAGLGISALASNMVPRGPANHRIKNLPELGEITIGFNYDNNNLPPAAAKLLDYLRLGLKSNQHYIKRNMQAN